MNKFELLAQLPAYPNNPKAAAVAKLGLTDDGVERLGKMLRRRKKYASMLEGFNFVLFLVVFISALLWASSENQTVSNDQLAAGVAALTVCGILRFHLGLPLGMLAQLSPLAGSEKCHEALELVTSGGPNVSLWRNLALSERNQLYTFDFNVMYLLAEQHRSGLEQVKRQAEIDVACRALHQVS